LILERKQADVGTSGLGRVVLTAPSVTSVQIAEDASPSEFGLKLNAITSTLSGATITQPTGTPAAMSVDLGVTNPAEGEQIKFTFNLPDGTTEDITLTASSATPLPANSFAIGATPTATAANLNAALNTSVGKLANGPLVAASAVTAGDNFFDQPPMRVGTAPLGAATTLVAGTPANTVSWYQGESGTDSARGTAVAQIDQSITVQYGARADEQALRSQLQTVAVFAAVTTSVTDPNANAQIAALNQRIAQNLADVPGTQSIQDIQADFAGAGASIKAATDRQAQTKAITQTMLDSIEGINDDEVATKILALQTSLQASYQTTATLYQMSLVKFL
jgi:flagellar hook-associated protein 3 FlgL